MNEYKQQIVDFYDGRDDYDNEFTCNRALSLLELVALESGQTILDLATGTGFIALEAAKKVGNQGQVIGIDFSPQMLKRCKNKINAAGLTNIELKYADIDHLDFTVSSFDAIFCSSAIVLFSDIVKTLENCLKWLKSDGLIAFSVYSQESFFTPVIIKVCHQLGYDLPNIHNLLGTPTKCQTILTNIGYREIKINKKQFGKYLTMAEAQKWWQGNWLHPQYHPLLKLDIQQREELKALFSSEVAKLVTDKGVWAESTMFIVSGQK